MGLQFDKALGLHADALRLRAARTKVLASNLANESTPGYQARDVDFAQALSRASGDDPFAVLDSGAPDLMYRLPQHASQDGNTVELSTEQTLFSENAVKYRTTLSFLEGRINTISRALKGE